MKASKAMQYFYGKEKYNCVQAILKVYQDDFEISDEHIKKAKKLGRGKAEDGICGALHAVKMLMIENDKPEVYRSVATKFQCAAGSVNCKAIRKMRKANCRECVGIAVKYLEEHIND